KFSIERISFLYFSLKSSPSPPTPSSSRKRELWRGGCAATARGVALPEPLACSIRLLNINVPLEFVYSNRSGVEIFVHFYFFAHL
ncbi:MAG: hypothetical protein IIY78_10350, partial [Clostridia bacterium]|nr:hypothetical protein [Clostridia bacterium]